MMMRSVLLRAGLIFGLAVGLGACANAVAPQPPVAAGGFGSLARSGEWGFGGRAQTPGFTFDRGFSGSGA